jgi:hypothetical protein
MKKIMIILLVLTLLLVSSAAVTAKIVSINGAAGDEWPVNNTVNNSATNTSFICNYSSNESFTNESHTYISLWANFNNSTEGELTLIYNYTSTESGGSDVNNTNVTITQDILDGNWTWACRGQDSTYNFSTDLNKEVYINMTGNYSIYINSSDPNASQPAINLSTSTGHFVKAGDILNISFMVNDSDLNLDNVNITILNATGNAGISYYNMTTTCVYANTSTGFWWNCSGLYVVNSSQNANYTIGVNTSDNASRRTYVNASNLDEDSTWFVIDNNVPVFSNPGYNNSSNKYISGKDTINISFIVNDTYYNNTMVNITIINASNSNLTINDTIANCTTTAPPASGSINCTLDWVPNATGNYTFKVTAYDNASNSASGIATDYNSDMWFQVYNSNTSVVTTSLFPESGSGTATLSTIISVAFDHHMDENNMSEDSSFYVNETDGTTVAGTVSTVDNITWIFDPTSDLSSDTQYNVTVTQRATDKAGNPMTTQSTWWFKTAGTGSPESPAGGGGGAGGAAVPAMKFEESVDAETGETVEIALMTLVEGSVRGVKMEVATSSGGTSTESHTMTVKEIGASWAVVTVASTPMDYTLRIGRPKYVDLNDDGLSDLRLELLGLKKGVADISVKKLADGFAAAKETVTVPSTTTAPIKDEPVDTSADEATTVSDVPTMPNLPQWVYWIIGLAIVGAGLAYWAVSKKK